MSAARPTLLLDIGPLGAAWDNPSGARGIHRVAEHLFEGLVQADRYNLEFLARTNWAGAHDFLLARNLNPQETLRFSPGQPPFSRFGQKATRWVHRNIGISGWSARAVRRAVSLFAQGAVLREKHTPPGFFAGADIFHSILAPLPIEIRKKTRLAKFLTIHDLLGLALPQFMPEAAPYAQRLLDSLSPDSFVFCVSEHVKADVLRFSRHPADQVLVTPLAADTQRFYPQRDASLFEKMRSRLGLGDSAYFLTLSSFDPRKNFGHIIRCFNQLAKNKSLAHTKLVIVGSNPERNRFVEEAIAANSAIRDRIILADFIHDEELAAVYSGAVAFLFPSFGEGFGLPVLEAMQCGTPVVCSDVTSLPEVVGDAGILLPPQDEKDWCQALVKLREDEAFRDDLARKGLLRSREYSWRRFMAATFDGYQKGLAMQETTSKPKLPDGRCA